jgi:hypothetical protein
LVRVSCMFALGQKWTIRPPPKSTVVRAAHLCEFGEHKHLEMSLNPTQIRRRAWSVAALGPQAAKPPRHPKHQENPAAAYSPLGSGRSILPAQTRASIGAETGIKTIAAVHSQCRLWVKSGQTIQRQLRPMSVVTPIADKLLQRRECPLCANRDRRTAANSALFDHLVGAAEQRVWHGEAKCLSGLEVDDKLEFSSRLHWKIGGLFAF